MTGRAAEGVPGNPPNFSDSWGICRKLPEVFDHRSVSRQQLGYREVQAGKVRLRGAAAR